MNLYLDERQNTVCPKLSIRLSTLVQSKGEGERLCNKTTCSWIGGNIKRIIPLDDRVEGVELIFNFWIEFEPSQSNQSLFVE